MSTHLLKPAAGLVEANTALVDLLDTLLAEVPEYVPASNPTATLNKPVGAPLTQIAVPPEVAVAAVHDAPGSPAADVESERQRVLPDWAQGEFKALVFAIGDLRLAVPLIVLDYIVVRPQAVTSVPGQPSWYAGVVQVRGSKLVLVELDGLLGLGPRASASHGGYLLVIGGGRYGLICDRIDDPVKLQPTQVNWRRGGDRREWLAGILPDHMCALVDVRAIENRIRHR